MPKFKETKLSIMQKQRNHVPLKEQEIFCPFIDLVVYLILSGMSCCIVCIFSNSIIYLFIFLNGFLCGAKPFKFNEVPLVYFYYFHYSRRWSRDNIAVICVKERSAFLL